MKRKIEYDEIIDENDELYAVNLVIDGEVYRLDKGELWSLHCIVENCFGRMEDLPGTERTPPNRKRVTAKP